MTGRERIIRVAVGLIVIGVILYIGFGLVLARIPTWGATPGEVTRDLPGDALMPDPAVNWTHAITIDAPAAVVWQWIAQIGERRGAFYSYTFIENRMGNGDVYHNADRIVPEWQNPKPADSLIGGGLPLELNSLDPGKWLLGISTGEMGWTWLWYVEPIDGGHTRLLIRNHIQPTGGASDPLIGTVINLGGFVMEQGMMQGIKARAEGNAPGPYNETFELILWLLTLAAGLAAGVFFVLFKDWGVPLLTGIAAVIALLLFTFVQPAVWVRVVVDVALWTGLAWYFLAQRASKLTPRPSPNVRPSTSTFRPKRKGANPSGRVG